MRGLSVKKFCQQMLCCISTDVIKDARSRATVRMQTHKEFKWFAKPSTHRQVLTVAVPSMKAVL